MESGKRPNRSDIHLSRQEEAEIEGKTRDYFDSMAPKRHSKPQRSEYASTYIDDFSGNDQNARFNPEYTQFQHLENDDPQQKFVYNATEVSEEFVETEYYKDLNCVDKQHHRTGTGFIKMENSSGNGFCLASDSPLVAHPSGKGNPATNDWIPADSDTVTIVSGKPNRREN